MTSIYDVLKASKGIHVDDTFAELWGRKLSNAYTVATYTGTLPATLRTVRGYLVSYKIYGNAIQAGTPTPENPIVPSECGERTENLYSSTLEQGTTAGGTLIPASNRVRSGLIYLGTGQFTFSCFNNDDYQIAVDYHLSDGTYSSGTSWLTTKTFELTNQTPIIRLKIRKPDDSSIVPTDVNNIMLNLGSTALPYIPFGYKLPLTANGVEYPIYLGEVETTRKVKKLVLTGEENWRQSSDGNIYIVLSPNQGVAWIRVLSTHFTSSQIQTNGNLLWFVNANVDFDTVDECKQHLAAQYAAGTPVTVWYILAKPKTGIVNEPLMKIGDYADTIDSTQANVQIPTVAGETTISWAGEGLAPSEVELTYRKPKGQ